MLFLPLLLTQITPMQPLLKGTGLPPSSREAAAVMAPVPDAPRFGLFRM